MIEDESTVSVKPNSPRRTTACDDHAPADIKDGQELVLAVYHALATGSH